MVGPPGRVRTPRGGGRPGRYPVDSGEVELLRDADRNAAWLLSVDGVPQSYVDLDDPAFLEFDYVRWMGWVLDAAAPPGAALSAVHVGGAGLTVPRYLAATRPGSRQVVFEPDVRLTALVREHLPLRRGGGSVRIRPTGGREGIAAMRAGHSDVVVVDAFSGGRVPAELVSTEFLAGVARVLRPSGVVLVNVADGPALRFGRRFLATVAGVFDHAVLVGEPAVLRGRRFGNLVVAACAAPLPVDRYARRAAADAFPARVVTDPGRFAAGARPFTDADAVPSPRAPSGTWGR